MVNYFYLGLKLTRNQSSFHMTFVMTQQFVRQNSGQYAYNNIAALFFVCRFESQGFFQFHDYSEFTFF